MATKNSPGQFDCYANAAPDEPMFVLCGRDKDAATLVRIWALLRHKKDEDPAKVREALRCADAMDAWAIGLGKSLSQPGTAIVELLITATSVLDEHPEGFDQPCNCDACRSYR
jgi:hypothetical protein